MRVHLVDTGPFVAYLDRTDHHHSWALETLSGLPAPLWTADSVIAESIYLLRSVKSAGDRLLHLVETAALRLHHLLPDETAPLRRFLNKYPEADYADACLVRLSETHPDSVIITLDTDFHHYRRNRNQVIPLIAPWA